jgi:hypothetical protein
VLQSAINVNNANRLICFPWDLQSQKTNRQGRQGNAGSLTANQANLANQESDRSILFAQIRVIGGSIDLLEFRRVRRVVVVQFPRLANLGVLGGSIFF